MEHFEPSEDTLFWQEYNAKQSKQILEDCEGYSSLTMLWTND